MATTAKAQAGRQLIFALCLLAVASIGYLLTRSMDVQPAPQQEASSTTPSSTQAVSEAGSAAADAYEGTYVCLPHREASGPQTLECALGIRTDDGRYYAVAGKAAIAESLSATTPTDARVRIVGELVPVDASDPAWGRYAVAGVIQAESFTQL